MKVIVFDVPAVDSGALTILRSFYEHVCLAGAKDIQWVFVVSTDALPMAEDPSRIRILRYPSAKRSWTRRIVFEVFTAHRVVRRLRADVVISLQSTAVIFCRRPQIIYVHQSLPYAPRRFSLLKREESFLFLYAGIFRFLIGWSVRKASAIVVQTGWLRDAILKRNRIGGGKIVVVPPGVRFAAPSGRIAREAGAFFYPTTPYVYKNIDRIVEAVVLLRKTGLMPVVSLTIRGDENHYAERLRRRIEVAGSQEAFRFLGRIARSEVIAFYRRAVLLFPSTLESFGLPLLEGRLAGASIIASDMPFCREILDGYSCAEYFDPWDGRSLAAAMRRHMTGEATGGSDHAETAVAVEYATEDHWGVVVDLAFRAGSARSKGVLA